MRQEKRFTLVEIFFLLAMLMGCITIIWVGFLVPIGEKTIDWAQSIPGMCFTTLEVGEETFGYISDDMYKECKGENDTFFSQEEINSSEFCMVFQSREWETLQELEAIINCENGNP